MAIIQCTVKYQKKYWVGIFERDDDSGYSVAKAIFGKEPSDPELYQFVVEQFEALKFSTPTSDFQLSIKRVNFKRMVREVRKEMRKAENLPRLTHAEEAMKHELEKNKKIRKVQSKAEKQRVEKEKFALKQQQKKQKMKGH